MDKELIKYDNMIKEILFKLDMFLVELKDHFWFLESNSKIEKPMIINFINRILYIIEKNKIIIKQTEICEIKEKCFTMLRNINYDNNELEYKRCLDKIESFRDIIIKL